jgi:hypothetical protein
MQAQTSRPKTHDVIHDVTDEKAPPNNKPKDRGQSRRCPAALIGMRPPPTYPICWQQAEADCSEILLKIEKAESMPVTVAFQIRLNVNFEVQVDDRPEQRGAQVQNNDGVCVPGWLHGAEATKEGMRMGAKCRPRAAAASASCHLGASSMGCH